MKKLLLNILTFIILVQFPAVSQTSISASAKTGCDTLTTRFSFQSSEKVQQVTWYFGDGSKSIENTPQHQYSSPGKYCISLVINESDSAAFPDFIEIGQTPEISITTSDTLISGSSNMAFSAVQMSKHNSDLSYSWNLSDGTINNNSGFIHSFADNKNQTAQLTVTDPVGCTRSISQAVSVLTKLEVPNVFSPNQDSKNDLLIIEGDGITTYSLEIYSRSGIKVFETQAKVLVWDGNMFSGEAVRDGIYYYVIQSVDSTVKLKQSGFFYLYR